ncbi:YihY/virulence factor BrkB family protein [Devosia sp. SD17-2]|uniref:YihY/virulence factor BrkB family protein n=1 Tax=Devosia sp. SD17-2 TaxID=2976459 RepID=UPI0023D82301|nr:YihY/virulence factor BrkB family protein [Devosia sp. SD17-2]WEJ34048.1 YihY/virulence factor BrkB family protein [Devosia sp. SD17-2]
MDKTVLRNAAQSGRGRNATAPTQIPPAGWRDICWRLFKAIAEDRILLTAAGVAFYVLLALVPTLNAFVSIYGLFNNPADAVGHLELLAGIVPPGALGIIREQLVRLTAESTERLGLTLLVSLAIALWSASAGVKAMFDAMNIAYHEKEKRSFLVFNGLALLFTLAGAVGAVLVAAVVIVMPLIIAYLPGGDGLAWTVRVAAYAMMLAVISLALAALYRWGPSRQNAKWRWITPGTILAVLALGLTSIAFSWYVANFSDDNAAYGSLGAVIGLMTWLWISVTLVIVGAELNSEIEHQTAHDTTSGPAQQLGARGAHMADSVGETWPRAKKGVEAETTHRVRQRFPVKSLGLALGVSALLRRGQSDRSGPTE